MTLARILRRGPADAPPPDPPADETGDTAEDGENRWRRRLTRAALVLAVAALAGTAALMLLDSGQQTPELPDLEFPPVIAEATRNVSEAEGLDMLASIINLTAWAGVTSSRAGSGEGFYAALLTGPGVECGQRPDGQMPESATDVMNCTETELERRSAQVPDWSNLTEEHRTAAAMKALEQTWWTKSPETMMQVRTARMRGMLLDREDPQFREFAELFDPCRDESYGYAQAIAVAPDEIRAGRAYLNAGLSMEQCVAAKIAQRFPKQSGEEVPVQPGADPAQEGIAGETLPAEEAN